MQRGYSLIFVIVGVLVGITIIAGAYYLGASKNPVIISQTPQPSPDETANPDLIGANSKTYTITPDSSLGYASYQIKLPIQWKQIEHSSNFQSTETFQDGQNIYQLTIEEQKNYNDQTKKAFADLRELTRLSYDVTTLTVDGQKAIRPLPRAGSEYIYQALFFSSDVKLVYSITLKTPADGSKIKEGEALFNQILSTFKFIDQKDNKNLDSIKSLEFDNGCLVKIAFTTKGEITMNPNPKEGEKCSHSYPPQISPDKKYGAVELRLLELDTKENKFFAANSVFVYFAAQQEWILANSFGAATVSNLTYDAENNLLITLFYEGKTFGTTRILLPKIAEQYEKAVNPKTKELQWQYSDLYIH